MSRLIRRAAVGAVLIAALASGGCIATMPAKMVKGVATVAVKHTAGAIF